MFIFEWSKKLEDAVKGIFSSLSLFKIPGLVLELKLKLELELELELKLKLESLLLLWVIISFDSELDLVPHNS